MGNYKKIQPSIAYFPDDDIKRVVCWYGPIKQNPAAPSLPIVYVALREIMPDGRLGETTITRIVSLADLDIVRLGSIWHGKYLTNDIWTNYPDYYQERLFEFDLEENPPDSITMNSFSPHIEIGNFSNKTKKAIFSKTKLTRMITVSGITVLVPSLEIGTSAYTTLRRLRNRLFLEQTQTIIGEYLLNHEHKDGLYEIETKNKLSDINRTFLAYLALNNKSKSRISKIMSSMLKSEKDKNGYDYREKYPDVLPYHPKEFKIIADGYMLDAQTALVLRILEISLPKEHVIKLKYHTTKPIEEEEKGLLNGDEKLRFHQKAQIDEDADATDITSESEPHKNAGIVKRKPHIKVMEDGSSRTEQEEIRDKDPSGKATEVSQEAHSLSSGDINSRMESGGVAAIRAANDGDDGDMADPAVENLVNVENALNQIIESEGSCLGSFVFVDNTGTLCSSRKYCTVPVSEFKDDESEGIGWTKISIKSTPSDSEHVKPKRVHYQRKIMVLKITKTDGKSCFLLDIERKNDSEQYLGMLFNIEKGSLTKEDLTNLLVSISKEKGHLTRAKKVGEQKVIEEKSFPVKCFCIFKHSNDKQRMRSFLEKAMEEAERRGVFC